MNEHMIKTLVEKTFSKLCSPASGHGMYAEIEKALSEAYSLGKAELNEADNIIRIVNVEKGFLISA